ncbi:GHMP family kinase ATP-binding protein [Leptospira sp. GIMC2001]|uniref:GHMP family kinase ATP-binding protein n=1 Tax=Leptospira sp. GIMC2001 TaxID=1513297 RepID=UPI00234A42B1|nr:hypothetical protein [Leptospira sp. GIMC2001]WCL51270.1 hypothetical protein O4O04_10805 [Leptospira sp. GIMC2001]
MIISRTPFRISFTGGGSDLKDYYEKFGGCVISTSIDKYIYLSIHPYFMENKYFLKYSNNELTNNAEDIKHNIIREVFLKYNINGVDFNSSADVPSGTGLGSSSCFTVGLINLCNAYTDKYMDKNSIADLACQIEIDVLKEPIGKQDQYGCAIGGLNFIEFDKDDSVIVEKISLRKDSYQKLEENLMMFYIGGTRSASDILEKQKKNTNDNQATINGLHKLVELTKLLRKELLSNNIDALGDILNTGWMYKRELSSNISNERIDHYYNLALKNGAIGGKLLGAGGSGFLLFYVPLEKQDKLRLALSEVQEFPFQFEKSGTSIIYYS